MKRYVFLFLLSSFSCCLFAQSVDSNHIVGIWQTPEKDVLIKIDKFGNSYQGRVVWLEASQEHTSSLDVNNPNEHLRGMPLKGSKIIEELTYDPASNCWDGGTYYNFREGKLYNCQVSLLKNNQIRVSTFTNPERDIEAEIWTRQ